MKAGTITFLGGFQLVALAVFLILVVGRTMHLLIHRKVNPITLGLMRKGKAGLMEVLLFAGVNLWAIAVVLCALQFQHTPFAWICSARLVNAMPAKLLGVAMILCAFVIFVLALSALGNSWRLGIDENHPGMLVTTGIYSHSRNPIYLFFDLYFLGTFLINGSLFFLIMAVLVALNLHYQILQEERFLATAHGAAYEGYCDRTARYVAWPNLVRSRR
ncbi:MAG TPA: isoprenylcysteine carboxylmethyltransferase family protein [Anaerolineae bacterium]|nr:isoprenylcysteine carboxylmethyltransferase family protein [Anaerolineae bacterium]